MKHLLIRLLGGHEQEITFGTWDDLMHHVATAMTSYAHNIKEVTMWEEGSKRPDTYVISRLKVGW